MTEKAEMDLWVAAGKNEIASSFPFLLLNICVDHIRQV